MRLPRRVPWASLAELEQVCSSIYADENDLEAKIFAINRISAWRVITSLPQAIESTLALLVVIVQDANKQASYPILLLRQSYAIAVLRLVNGLVDPLQVGTYARPIASIAQQLGLPSWLVELRHAATHEDLPSIDLLREAARQSMSWLLHNYYLPTLNPIPTLRELEAAAPVRHLLPILKFYKGTMKTITRDVSLIPQHRTKLVTVLRDLERWIAECKVTANVALGEVGWTAESSGTLGSADPKDVWALERFCDGLVSKGMLVPLSKKKRHPTESFLPSNASISFWEVLLQHVRSLHSDFPHIFCHHLISVLLYSSNSTLEDTDQRPDPSHQAYLACWVMWAVESWSDSSSTSLDLRKSTLSRLMKGMFSVSMVFQSESAPMTLMKALSTGQEDFEELTALLLRPQSQFMKSEWDPQDLDIMNERNRTLQAAGDSKGEESSSVTQVESSAQNIDIPGWRVLDDVNWKPCPLGIYQSS